MKDAPATLKRRISQSLIALFSLLLISGTIFTFEIFAADDHSSPEQNITASAQQGSNTTMWGLIAAAIAFGLGALGAGLAISNVGAAAMGAVAEKPEIAGQALIFVALAEGLVVFGFIMGLLILGKV
ncbi:MAG: ATP synthase subunit C [Candidatus Pacearchaeota archaeon]|nr:ATP synthase subunit C [Candidatus Pacearchaeota archaeon]